MIDKSVVISENICEEVDKAIAEISPDKVFVLYDCTTFVHCSPLLAGCSGLRNAETLHIKATAANKTLEPLASEWT